MKHIKIVIAFFIFTYTCNLSAQSTTAADSSKAATTEAATIAPETATPPAATEPVATEPAATVTETTTTAEPPATINTVSDEATTVAEPVSVNPTTPTNYSTVNAKAIRKGNLLYSQQAYFEAIPYYEKALKTDATNKLILSNLGNCYRLTNNVKGQLLCYGGLVNLGSAEPIQELYYGEALVENGEAEKAKPFFEKFSTDARGKELASSLDKAKAYAKNSDAYTLVLSGFNSPQNDLCAVKFYDAVVFASTRTKTKWINREHAWTDGTFMGLYTTEKDGNGGDMEPQVFMGDLDSKFNDGPICFSKDFNTVYFTRNNSKKEDKSKDGTYKLEILEASLDQNGFSRVLKLPFNNKDYNFAHPSVSLDGYTMFFASDMEGGKGGMDIYASKKDSSGVWGTPVNLGDKVNTAGNEMFPFIAANGLLYFSSNGHDGLGGLDIYEAKMKDGQVAKVYNMGLPVNGKDDDFGIFLNEDNKTGYVSSNRKAGGMDDDIYELTILRDVKRGKEVVIVTKDKTSNEPIANSKLVINGDSITTNEKGEYATSLEEDKTYKLEALKDDYFKAEDSVSSNSSLEDSFTKEILLEKDPKLFLKGLITDSKTNALLDSVSIKVTDISAGSDFDTYTTNSAGDYFKFLWGKKIGDKLTYLIRLERRGYLQRTIVFTHDIAKGGEIDMNQLVSLSLGKVEVGMDIAKMIDMKPIYFDLAKSAIRPDAAIELDKIVQVMNEYPNMYIELGSHTDCRSSAASNMKLSTARAKASADYIIKKGINKARIVGKGYGETKLLNNCACEGKKPSPCPEEEHTKNRRTEFLITKLK